MKSLDVKILQLKPNIIESFSIPEFSDILDISFDNFGDLKLLYQYDIEHYSNKKNYNLWIIDSINVYSPPTDNYKFFGRIEKKYTEINLGNTTNGIISPIEDLKTYYVFIEEIKTVAEHRDEILSDIL